MDTWRERVWVPPLVKRSTVKRQLITYIGQFFRCVFTFSQLTGFFSHT